MRLTEDVCLVGSGVQGMNLTDPYDCHIYLLDGGDEIAIIDIGSGMGVDQVIENIVKDGYSLDKLKYLFLTHAHADHAGGAKKFVERTRVKVIASKIAADFLERGDEKAINLEPAKIAGIYPLEYTFDACAVDQVVEEGDELKVGKHVLQVIDTPGHCTGHVSYLLHTEAKTYLFAGDVIFFGGKILVQYINDCNVFDYGNSIYKLQNLKVDCLLSGHETIVLKDGQQHIDKAIEKLGSLGMPTSLF